MKMLTFKAHEPPDNPALPFRVAGYARDGFKWTIDFVATEPEAQAMAERFVDDATRNSVHVHEWRPEMGGWVERGYAYFGGDGETYYHEHPRAT